MSDTNLDIQRQLLALQSGHELLRKAETPALYPPWAQRVVNPFPLASSGGGWGDCAQPWEASLAAFSCSVFVQTTNSATQFWTIRLLDTASATLASFTTAAVTANTWTRLSTTSFTQPGASNVALTMTVTATLSPGAIFIVPTLALFRTGA